MAGLYIVYIAVGLIGFIIGGNEARIDACPKVPPSEQSAAKCPPDTKR